MHRRNFVTKLTWILVASAIAGGAFLTYIRPGWESISMLGAAALLALMTWLSRPRKALVDDHSGRVFEEASRQMLAGNAPEAEALMRGDFERIRRANGASHPTTLLAAQQLCTFLVAMGRREEARELMRQLEPTLREERKDAPDVWAVVMQSAANLWLDAELTRDAQAMAALGLRYASRMKEPHRRRLELGLLGCHARAKAQLGHAREALVETQALLEEAKTRFGEADPLTQQLAITFMRAQALSGTRNILTPP